MDNSVLINLYNKYLEEFNKTGEREHPSRLLALLLLNEKENYEPLLIDEGGFYKKYKTQIDNKIEKIVRDFKITKNDIIKYIQQTVISLEQDFEKDKIWFVFAEGFGCMHWGNMYHKEDKPEDIYFDYFGISKQDEPKILVLNNNKRI